MAARVSTIESTVSSLGDAAYASIFAPMGDETIASAYTSSALVTVSQVYDYVTAEVSNLNLGNAAYSTVLSEFPGQGDDDGLVTANTIAGYVQGIVENIGANAISYSAYDETSGTGFSGGVTNSTNTVEAAI